MNKISRFISLNESHEKYYKYSSSYLYAKPFTSCIVLFGNRDDIYKLASIIYGIKIFLFDSHVILIFNYNLTNEDVAKLQKINSNIQIINDSESQIINYLKSSKIITNSNFYNIVASNYYLMIFLCIFALTSKYDKVFFLSNDSIIIKNFNEIFNSSTNLLPYDYKYSQLPKILLLTKKIPADCLTASIINNFCSESYNENINKFIEDTLNLCNIKFSIFSEAYSSGLMDIPYIKSHFDISIFFQPHNFQLLATKEFLTLFPEYISLYNYWRIHYDDFDVNSVLQPLFNKERLEHFIHPQDSTC